MAHLSESRERYVKWGRSSCWLLKEGGYVEGRGTSTSGITEIGNYGHTEKPEGRYDGYTEGRNNGM